MRIAGIYEPRQKVSNILFRFLLISPSFSHSFSINERTFHLMRYSRAITPIRFILLLLFFLDAAMSWAEKSFNKVNIHKSSINTVGKQERLGTKLKNIYKYPHFMLQKKKNQKTKRKKYDYVSAQPISYKVSLLSSFVCSYSFRV